MSGTYLVIWGLKSDVPTGAQDLDSIRLSTYRTACKLRFVQKKCNCAYEFLCIDFLRCCTWPSQKGLRWRLPVFSAFGRHLERHRGFPGERPQRHRPQRWAFRGSSRSCAVHYLLPAEQAHAHHASDKRGTVHQPAAQLPAGSLWPVSKRVTWRAGCWLCTFTSEVLTWVDAAWNVTVKIQTLFPF